MKIETGFITGFLVMGLVLVVAVCTTLRTRFKNTDVVNNEEKSNCELNEINILSQGFNEGCSVGLKNFPEDHQTDADYLNGQRKSLDDETTSLDNTKQHVHINQIIKTIAG